MGNGWKLVVRVKTTSWSLPLSSCLSNQLLSSWMTHSWNRVSRFFMTRPRLNWIQMSVDPLRSHVDTRRRIFPLVMLTVPARPSPFLKCGVGLGVELIWNNILLLYNVPAFSFSYLVAFESLVPFSLSKPLLSRAVHFLSPWPHQWLHLVSRITLPAWLRLMAYMLKTCMSRHLVGSVQLACFSYGVILQLILMPFYFSINPDLR